FAGWDVAAILTLIAQSRDRYNPAFRMVFLWHRRRGERSRSHAHRFAQIKNKRFPLRTLPTSYLCLIGVNGFGIAHHGVCGERIFDAVNSHRRRDRSLVSEISASSAKKFIGMHRLDEILRAKRAEIEQLRPQAHELHRQAEERNDF